jgi:hypothetical protein
MILIGSQFEISSSLNLSFIFHNVASVRKADRITFLGQCMILIGSQFVILSNRISGPY